MSKILNPSEAIYGFAAWLMDRSEEVVFGGNTNDGASMVEST